MDGAASELRLQLPHLLLPAWQPRQLGLLLCRQRRAARLLVRQRLRLGWGGGWAESGWAGGWVGGWWVGGHGCACRGRQAEGRTRRGGCACMCASARGSLPCPLRPPAASSSSALESASQCWGAPLPQAPSLPPRVQRVQRHRRRRPGSAMPPRRRLPRRRRCRRPPSRCRCPPPAPPASSPSALRFWQRTWSLAWEALQECGRCDEARRDQCNECCSQAAGTWPMPALRTRLPSALPSRTPSAEALSTATPQAPHNLPPLRSLKAARQKACCLLRPAAASPAVSSNPGHLGTFCRLCSGPEQAGRQAGRQQL